MCGLKKKNASQHQPRETFCEKTEGTMEKSLQIQGRLLRFEMEFFFKSFSNKSPYTFAV